MFLSTGRRQSELDATVKEIGKNITRVQRDLSNLADLDRLYDTVKRQKDRIDVLFATMTRTEFDNAFKSNGLLCTEFNVLHAIYKSDFTRISDLAARLGMDRTTLTRNLAILEREGLIKISEGKDHRTSM